MRWKKIRHAEAEGSPVDDPTQLQSQIGLDGKRFQIAGRHHLETSRWIQNKARATQQCQSHLNLQQTVMVL